MEAVVAGFRGEEVGLGNEFEFTGVVCEEPGDLVLVLGGEDGAGGVKEFAAGLGHFRILGNGAAPGWSGRGRGRRA